MEAVINRYLNRGSKVYACLIDASKAFDTVDHRILFDKLLERNMPNPLSVIYCAGTRLSNYVSTGWGGLLTTSRFPTGFVKVVF